ncbi:DNA polymerase beta superfamily protein [Paenilisteria newyorkensis]|uniref:DNA polymerase beta superfamily protein n=1 Tax=Listeria newyorkensis TaxID=1497681 RepID=UPI000669B70D|nr:nucleotidyltransferase domain-containing protein [Listeria newyorkensis]KMT62918.1 putative nucleotidyltransferase [Listeria newyorkensis]
MTKYDAVIETSAYDFLRDNRDLRGIAYLVASGSHGYGTNIETSDLDLRGFLIEDKRYLFGLNTFEQFEEKETDTVIFGAQKFMKLCAQGNPNVLELLGVDEDEIVICSEAGRVVRDNVDLFLSKRVEQTFGNYANAQLKRLQNALVRNEASQAVQEQHVLETLQRQMKHFEGKYADLGDNGLVLRMENAEIVMDAMLRGYPLRDFVGIYGEMQGTMRTYGKLGTTEHPKDLPRLYKHAMHLVRMLVTGRDILEGKGIITKRRIEHELLMAIRNGEISFEEIFEQVAVLQKEFERAARETDLPEQVDMIQVEELLISLYR